MKHIKIITIGLVMTIGLFLQGCINEFLDYKPQDKLTSAVFPENEDDIKMLLNGVYALLRETSISDQGLFGFGILDGATPNAFNWGINIDIAQAGNGTLTTSATKTLLFRWTRCYTIISRANYFMKVIEFVDLNESVKAVYLGEAHFLRGLAYSILVESYGGVPIIDLNMSAEESRTVSRASTEEVWLQAINDYNIAINNLTKDAPETGRATKGAALGLKMRAYLYQNKYEEVLEVIEQIDALNKYALFPSYEGLFSPKNENNKEVLFDIQYIRGENLQGSWVDQYCGTGTPGQTRGSRYVPTDNLVDAYETIDGSPIDPENPYKNRDPRLAFTVVLPGSYILGYQFPNYIYPNGAYNNAGCALKHFSTRKYRIQSMNELPPAGQSYINNIVLRYADVILSKAEAIIETNGNISDAIKLINRIRTERNDVNIYELPTNLSRDEARKRLRHERRIEFALEGLYWMDIKRWNIGKDIYPVYVKDHTGNIIETKFPEGYLEHYNLLPIPDSERSMNKNLTQNPGW